MPRVRFIRPGGEHVDVEAPEGESVMRAALTNGIYEIPGECGGALACATCHVYVDPEFLDRLPPITPDEDEMLDFAETPRKENSRLSCQIPVTAELDGITVKIEATG